MKPRSLSHPSATPISERSMDSSYVSSTSDHPSTKVDLITDTVHYAWHQETSRDS